MHIIPLEDQVELIGGLIRTIKKLVARLPDGLSPYLRLLVDLVGCTLGTAEEALHVLEVSLRKALKEAGSSPDPGSELLDELHERVAGTRPSGVINLDTWRLDPEIVRIVPREVAVKHCLIVLLRNENTLTVVTDDATNMFAIDDVRFLTGYKVKVVVAPREQIEAAIKKYYPPDTDPAA